MNSNRSVNELMNSEINYSGKVIDNRYQLIRFVSRGGMGVVYLGRHVTVGRTLAVKILHTKYKDNSDMIARFYREAQSAASVKHRNVVDVFDMGVTEWGEPYLVMEFLDGQSLAGVLRDIDGPVSLAATCAVMVPVLDALSAMHERNVIHRDIKPDNIIVVQQEGRPPDIKVIDFGISKITHPDVPQITKEGAIIGTLDYMAPEQLSSDADILPTADIYAVGVVCYQMMTRCLPYAATSMGSLVAKKLHEPPTSPDVVCADFPSEMASTIMRALAPKPGQRYQTAREMREALSQLSSESERSSAFVEMVSSFVPFDTRESKNPSAALAVLREMTPVDVASSAQGPKISLGDDTALDGRLAASETPTSWSQHVATRCWFKNRINRVGLSITLLAVASILVAALLFGHRRTIASPGISGRVVSNIVSEASNTVRLTSADISVSDLSMKKLISPADVRVQVRGLPDGAVLKRNGISISDNPFILPCSLNPIILTIEASGYQTESIEVVPDDNRIVEVSMTRIEAVRGENVTPPSSSTKDRKNKQPEKTGKRHSRISRTSSLKLKNSMETDFE